MPAAVTEVTKKPSAARNGGFLPILIPGPKKPPELSKRALAKLRKKADHAAAGHRQMQAARAKAAASAGEHDAKTLRAMAAEHALAAERYERKSAELAKQAETARP